MAIDTFYNPYFEYNGVVLTGRVRSVDVDVATQALDATVSGNTHQVFKPGLIVLGLKAKLLQDYAAGSVDAAFATQANAGPLQTAATVKIRPKNAAASTTNPERSGSAIITAYPPIKGSIGTLQEPEVSFVPAADWAIVTA